MNQTISRPLQKCSRSRSMLFRRCAQFSDVVYRPMFSPAIRSGGGDACNTR